MKIINGPPNRVMGVNMTRIIHILRQKGGAWRCMIVILLLFVGIVSATADVAVLWDESVDGDLSDDMGAPTLLAIDNPGEYLLRTTTGPMELLRREQPAEISGLRLEALQRLDGNMDSRLQRSEATGNYAVHFQTFDLDGNNELAFNEIAQFDLGGDVHDLFDFIQADGINLVAIKVNGFDGGGAQNDVSVLVVMDHKLGRWREARGVEITSKSEQEMANHQAANPTVILGPARAGMEIFEKFEIWKAYRQNDVSSHFRIGEMQARAVTELIFVFE